MSAALPMVSQLTTTEKTQLQREARMVVDLVQNLHYSGGTFHEVKNQEILTRFLQELDPNFDFFTPDDVAFVHERFDRSLKSVYLFRGDLEPAFEIFDTYTGLVRDRLAWIDQRLAGNFDFTGSETYRDPQLGDPPSTLPPDQNWELRLKDEMLHEMLSGRSLDEARAKLRSVYAEFGHNLAAFDSFAVRERFLDASIRSFDPHSGYSSADSTREFSIKMTGLVTGVGIAIAKEHNRCVLSGVYPGSPADLHSTLAPGDCIEALAQGEGPWIDIATQPLREIIAALQDPATGKLRIAYRAGGIGERMEVTLEKTQVVIREDRARGAVSKVPLDAAGFRSIGWIVLPSFYTGGEGPDHVSAARDVRGLINKMKAAGPLDGLVLDLRNNPGGTLDEAEAMSQVFLPGGTIMLSSGVNGLLKVHAVEEQKPLFTGPLVILTSAASASSSEIFASAMKYYHRALIVGATTTFGKGTVQNYFDLARIQGLTGEAVKDWGTLRLTTERFYLPDGRGMQRRGVPSDVVLPDYEPIGFQREADLPHALAIEDVTPPTEPQSAAARVIDLTGEQQQFLSATATMDFTTLPEWKLWREEQNLEQTFFRQTRSLNLSKRSEAWEVTLGRLKAARKDRRELSAQVSFATQPLEISEVQQSQDHHRAKLRALEPVAGQPALHRLYRGGFLIETDLGHLRDVSLQEIDFLSLLGDADTLATSFSKGSGQTVKASQVRTFLETLAMLDTKTDHAVEELARKLVPNATDPGAWQRGLEAALQRITELEPGLREERPSLDVPLRECLRLAARWPAATAAPHP